MPIPKSSGGEMPFLDHLEELRWRIIYSLVGVLIGLAIGLVIAFKFDILAFLQGPVAPYLRGHRLVVLHPMDPFNIKIQIAFAIGFLIAIPVVGYQLWLFMAPALHKPEKRVIIPVLFSAVVLFLIGVALAWFYVLPMTLKWLYGQLGNSLDPMYSADEYFGFITTMALAFGAAFQAPLLLVALSALGIISYKTLNKSRKYAVLIIWIAAAIISPGDAVIATIALAIPLYILYELSIIVSFFIERKRVARKAREAQEELAAE